MLGNDPFWYKDAIIYELHVRAFHDSIGDGYGDFQGLTQKLDYLEDLGITAIWLLPFYPSPLKDDGYDIADYTSVHRQYGRLEDFKLFLEEAHRRGIRVITELVINHTSDQHPWFQRARHAPPGSEERNFYVWSDTPEKYTDARIIFKDFELSNWAWDPVAKAYYWHRFYSHQPDLNYDNPAVWEALLPVMDFWFDIGVDGMRLDAVPYLYEREGTNCENLPETHHFLKKLRKHLDTKYPDRMFLAEANQWPEDAVAYFGNGDECHMAFHFPLMPRLFMSLHQEDRFPILDILAQTPPIPENCQWCMFLRNHDELTLEMVTDEERDYMYRAYAEDPHARINLGIRHRLAPLLKNDRRRIELMNALLFSLPGTPVVYYGDEIGMGDNIYLGDRNGVRTPMQWSPDRNAGFSRTNPQRLYLPVIIDPEYHYEAVNVESQQNNASSLLWWMKRLIALRKRHKAFGRGTLEFLRPANSKVLVFIRKYEEEQILVVANLSRFVQHVELDLRSYKGLVLEELFSGNPFPRITEHPYSLSMGPHGFYWFAMRPVQPMVVGDVEPDQGLQLPMLYANGDWVDWVRGTGRDEVEAVLPNYLQRREAFWDRRTPTVTRIQSVFAIGREEFVIALLMVRCEFGSGLPETVALPVTVLPETMIEQLLAPPGVSVMARLQSPTLSGLVCDALAVSECAAAILRGFFTNRRAVDGPAEIALISLPGLASFGLPQPEEVKPKLLRSWRNNISVLFGDQFILKTLRRAEPGSNPDLEVSRFLTEVQRFDKTAPVLGQIEYRARGAESVTLGVLHRFVVNQGDAWQYTLDKLSSFYERVAALSRVSPPQPPKVESIFSAIKTNTPDDWSELAGNYEATAALIGKRTAELHQALIGNRQHLPFAPEPFTKLYQRSLYQSMRMLTGQLMLRLQQHRDRLAESIRPELDLFLAQHDTLLSRFRQLLDTDIDGFRIRVHGDYHLGQLLYTGKDFVIVDFEGEPARTLGERQIKRSPLRDVAGMIRSLEYAAYTVLYGLANGRGRSQGQVREEDRTTLEPWAQSWVNRASRAFLSAYLEEMQNQALLPPDMPTTQMLLEVFLLEKALQEIDHELSMRPSWIIIPLRAALRMLGKPI